MTCWSRYHSSLLMLLWSFNSIASLMVVSMYLDLEQQVLMLSGWIHYLRLMQCWSSYYFCLLLLVQQPPISSFHLIFLLSIFLTHIFIFIFKHTHINFPDFW
jgi:hypothetical protein